MQALTSGVVTGRVVAGAIIAAVFALAVGAAPAAAAAPSVPAASSIETPVATSPVVVAGVEDFAVESFDAVYRLDVDGDGRAVAHVTETIVAVFPEFDQNRGIVRAIPLRDQGYGLGLVVRSVTDESGAAVPWERTDADGFAELALGTDDFVHGRTTYVIDYELHDVIRHFADHDVDEFYWDVNGDGWAQPFAAVTARVELAPALAAALTGSAACYVGESGATDRCEIVRDGDAVTAAAGPLGPHETMTVAIGLAPGTVVQPARPQDGWLVAVLPWLLLIASAAVLVLAIVLRSTRWRDPRPRRAIIAQYEPPARGGIELDGDVIGRSDRVFAAMLVDLAVRGRIRILDQGAGSAARYVVERVDLDGLAGAEARVVAALLPDDGQAVADLGDLDAATGATIHGILAGARASAIRAGLRAAASGRWARWLRAISWVIVGGFVLPLGWMLWFDVESGSVILGGIGAVVVAVAVGAVTVPPTLLTAAGADRRDHLEGMRVYLTVAEEARIRMLQSPEGAPRGTRIDASDDDGRGGGRGDDAEDALDPAMIVRLNERLLPWAVLWGVEERWAEVLRAEYASAAVTPVWTTAALDGDLLRWVGHTSSSRIVPLAATSSGSSWSGSGGSSFSSGSFGGGFAGGGGGGGGGGGR